MPLKPLPGVVAVLTRADLSQGNSHFGPVVKDQPIVALDRVRYAGEVVAAVAAEEPDIAEEAVDLIRVEYEPLTPVVDPVAAMAPGAPILHETRVRSESRLDAAHYRYEDRSNVLTSYNVGRGDPEEGFAASDLVFEDTYTTPKIQHGHLEPHVVTAFWDAAGKLTVYSATQNPSSIRVQLAELFELPQSMVRVVVPYVGGGYGGKVHLRLEPLAAALARKARRPVQWKLTREEVFLTGHCHASVVRIKTGVKRDGTILARQVEAVYDTGAYALTGPSTSRNGGEVSGGPYRIPHQRLTSYCVYTNTRPPDPTGGSACPRCAGPTRRRWTTWPAGWSWIRWRCGSGTWFTTATSSSPAIPWKRWGWRIVSGPRPKPWGGRARRSRRPGPRRRWCAAREWPS